ncbi:hypothetical protein EJ04DRAFT_120038 [Polyplosphaeria fusca]|uniref:Uncharacterized protein n=1 Tax=Polyplosphaeria fusca TaxID=682080 RepID=A0A9P4UWQ2_9PLEO|nr:hypothetical protein EJ04DRAFT_120038 [Polyplosphaeria fusca]
MATPNSRRTTRAPPQTPPTTNTTPSKDSAFVEPKSEFLRSALEARRAKDAPPTPTAAERPAPRRTASIASSHDPWIEQATSEDDRPLKTPARRARRPSDGGIPRMATHKELQGETESLRQTVLDLRLKLELVREQTTKMKDALEAANERIEELEPFEEQIMDLRDENKALLLTNYDLEQDLAEKGDENAEILQIQEETVRQMEQHQVALEEAADVIFQAEKSNAALREENIKLKAELASARSSASGGSCYDTPLDDSPQKAPVRIYSIDESRPSTSHFDSDYFSQPASPHVKPKKPSKEGLAFTERAKHFLELNVSGRQSVQELKKRVSDISMKKNAPVEAVPAVPPIPEDLDVYQQKAAKRNPARRAQAPQAPPLDTGRASHRSIPTTPKTPTGPKDGLRDLFRSGRSVGTPGISHTRKSTTPSKSSGASDSGHHSAFSPPARQSSRHQTQTGFSERSASVQNLSAEWEAPEMPPAPSIVTDDAPSEADPRERWWKDLRNYPQQPDRGARDAIAMASQATASSARGRRSELSGDFLFNMAEDEEQFIARAHQHMGGRRR